MPTATWCRRCAVSATKPHCAPVLLDGTIDAICSDHSPVDEDAKQMPFAEAEAGATGMELLLPLVLKWAAEDKIALPDALARVTINPAQMLGVKTGHLSVERMPMCACSIPPPSGRLNPPR